MPPLGMVLVFSLADPSNVVRVQAFKPLSPPFEIADDIGVGSRTKRDQPLIAWTSFRPHCKTVPSLFLIAALSCGGVREGGSSTSVPCDPIDLIDERPHRERLGQDRQPTTKGRPQLVRKARRQVSGDDHDRQSGP